MSTKPWTEQNEEVSLLENTDHERQLIVHNDDVNTFDWVIKSLIEICDHELIQAEQCTLIIHNAGKCAVKHGSYDSLKPMKDGLTDRGLSATINES